MQSRVKEPLLMAVLSGIRTDRFISPKLCRKPKSLPRLFGTETRRAPRRYHLSAFTVFRRNFWTSDTDSSHKRRWRSAACDL